MPMLSIGYNHYFYGTLTKMKNFSNESLKRMSIVQQYQIYSPFNKDGSISDDPDIPIE